MVKNVPIFGSVSNKIDFDFNWDNLTVPFTPMQGEIVIYMLTEEKIDNIGNLRRVHTGKKKLKIGDGVTELKNLQFVMEFDESDYFLKSVNRLDPNKVTGTHVGGTFNDGELDWGDGPTFGSIFDLPVTPGQQLSYQYTDPGTQIRQFGSVLYRIRNDAGVVIEEKVLNAVQGPITVPPEGTSADIEFTPYSVDWECALVDRSDIIPYTPYSDSALKLKHDLLLIDSVLSETSRNPVENKTITTAINGIWETLSAAVNGVEVVNNAIVIHYVDKEDTTIDLGSIGGGSGTDGLTPHIGTNGNWFIGETDTGVKAKAEDGKTPVKGVDYFTPKDVKDVASKAVDLLPLTSDVVDDEDLIPTSGAVSRDAHERYLRTLDRVGPLGGAKNCLDFYDSSLIDVEYVNDLPSWEVRFIDKSNNNGDTTPGISIESGRYISRRDPITLHGSVDHQVVFNTSADYVPGSSCQLSLCTTDSLQNQELWVESVELRTDSGVDGDDIQIIGDNKPQSSLDVSFDGYISNGDFETGDLTSWENVWNANAVTIVKGRNSEHAIQVTAGQWSIIRQKVTVEKNTDYVIKVWAKDCANASLLIKDSSDTNNIKNQLMPTGENWQETTVHFNSGDNTSIYIGFMGNSSQSKYTVDEILLCNKATLSGVVNGDFEEGSNGWQLTSHGTIVKGGHTGYHSLKISQPLPWERVATQTVHVKANTRYVISWWAKRVEGSGTFNLLVHNSNDKGVSRILGQNWMNHSGTDWTHYACEYDSSTNVKLSLHFTTESENPGSILIDDVRIDEVPRKTSNVCDPDLWYHNGSPRLMNRPVAVCLTAGNLTYYERMYYRDNLILTPNTRYVLTVRAKSVIDLDKLDWSPYTTFSDRDKISLVTEGVVPEEDLKCGGPWIGETIDSTHILKVRIRGSEDNPLYINSLSLVAKNVSSEFGYINVEPKLLYKGTIVDTVDSMRVNYCPQGGAIIRTRLKNAVDLLGGSEDIGDDTSVNAVDTIEFIIHPVPQLTDGEGPTPLITKIFAYGYRKNINYDHLPYEIGPEKELRVKNKLKVDSLLDAPIDDGCLDIY